MQKRPTALITGVMGQDGSYLAELLLNKGYKVVGIDLPRKNDAHCNSNIASFAEKLEVRMGDILDTAFVTAILIETSPDEIYHLAASSFVNYSPAAEMEILSKNISGTHNLLAAFKEFTPEAKFFFAGTSEMFGQPQYQPQTLNTPFFPRSVYGISKLCGHNLVTYYRNHFGLFAVTGILFNHESPRRGPNFVTQKIARAAVEIKFGMQDKLVLGNLDSRRDWGHARDYVYGFWQQLQHTEKQDFIFATGQTHSVREFAQKAFSHVGLNYEKYIRISDEFFRPAEKIELVGDAAEARSKLGWKTHYKFDDIIAEMMEYQLRFQSN